MRSSAQKRLATALDGSSSPFGTGAADERAHQTAYLLREALALLSTEAAAAFTPQRGADRLLRMPEVQRLTGLRRSAIYEQMQRGAFPQSVKLGPRATSWSEAAVQAWIAQRLDADARR